MEKSAEAFRTISEVAEELDLPQHVLRFWETRFIQIKPLKRGGGRRYYRPDDVELLRAIRQLLYGEGYTIKGVQKILKEQGVRSVIAAYRAAAAVGGDRMSLIFGPAAETETDPGTRFEQAIRPAAARNGAHGLGAPAPEGEDFGGLDCEVPGIPATPLHDADLRQLEALLGEIDECERILHAARSRS
jgi:DNA-binding transcriptional MerR regulator